MGDSDDALSLSASENTMEMDKKLESELDTNLQDQGTRFHIQLICHLKIYL